MRRYQWTGDKVSEMEIGDAMGDKDVMGCYGLVWDSKLDEGI